MNRILLILVLAMLLGPGAHARETVNINKGWRFFTWAEGREVSRQVDLPHTWNRDAQAVGRGYYRGAGNYIRHITPPASWAGQRIYLRSYGANAVADVFVNGSYAGGHKGGYTAFTLDITRLLKPGERNVILVVVNNAPRLDVLPTGGDMNVYGGLYRDVELLVCGSSHVAPDDYGADGIYLRQKKVDEGKAECDAVVRLNGTKDRNVALAFFVANHDGDTVASAEARVRIDALGKGSATMPFEIEKPVLWDGMRNPYLYKAWVKVYDGPALTDSVSLPLGVRYFNFDTDRGFMLNGKPYRLRGVVTTEDRLGVGNAVSRAQTIEDLDLICEMGANAVRTSLPHSRAFYELCDKRGIIVWSDLPLIGPTYITERGYIDSPAFRENGRNQLTEIIRQGYNNPSILMWGIFADLNTRGDDPVPYVQELASLASREDPGRPTVASSNQDGNINFATDLISWDHEYGWHEGLPSDIAVWLDEYRVSWSKLRTGINYGAGGSVYQQGDSLYRPSVNGLFHPERWQTSLHETYFAYVNPVEWLWGCFISNMFDYGAATRRWGDGSGVDDRGLVTLDRKTRKDAFYFYKANWNDSNKFLYIAERRWDNRPDRPQTVKVFSNVSEAELFVNGVSQGVRQPVSGVMRWDGVVMKVGDNNIEVLSGRLKDNCNIRIVPAGAVKL